MFGYPKRMGDQLGTSLDTDLSYVPRRVFEHVYAAGLSPHARAQLFADLCRINVLYMVARAGSGHLGSSFSSMELMSWLLLEQLDACAPNQHGNLYFSSKGHDAPAFYALLIALGHLAETELHSLRRLGGLPGHPDRETPVIAANTGSLGMGISKAKGMIQAHRALGQSRRVFVLTGDGELQEGQIWESLATAVHARMHELTVIVDHNRLQSDGFVSETSELGDLPAKFASFGWRVSRIDGHALEAIELALREVPSDDRPHIVIADTTKGRGVSFMEPSAIESANAIYRYHSGAPTAEAYRRAVRELSSRMRRHFERLGLGAFELEQVTRAPALAKPGARKLTDAYGSALLAHMERNPKLFVLDADLAVDLGIRPIKERFPRRFLECGIAEMDMVSQAGGLALRGALPVCHSFACFLSARPNEQIYNNASERTRVIYTAGLAGLLPAGPGHSHQGIRDIAALGGIPGLTMLQPCDERELEQALEYAMKQPGSTYLRLCALPVELPFSTPAERELREGCGASVRRGGDALLIGYGPVMLTQAYLAAELLAENHGIELEVASLPWLNRVDAAWLREVLADRPWLFTIDDHYLANGQGQLLAATLADLGLHTVRVHRFGVRGWPACGAPDEVLAHHGLDARSLAREIAACCESKLPPAGLTGWRANGPRPSA